MEISVSASVICEDSACGQTSGVIIDPVQEKITHLVVAESMLPHTQRLVPIEEIQTSSNKQILIKCTLHEFEKMEPLVETHFIHGETDLSDVATGYEYSGPVMYWPYSYEVPDNEAMEMHENIPHNELQLRRGAIVEALDGFVGEVDEFVVVPKAGCITHLVLKEGHAFGAKDVIIPVELIGHITENTVYLKASKLDISKLPVIPLGRPWKLEGKISQEKVFDYGVARFVAQDPYDPSQIQAELNKLFSEMDGVLDWVIRQDGEVAVEYDHDRINDQIIEEALMGVGLNLKHLEDDADMPYDAAQETLLEEEAVVKKGAAGKCIDD